MEVYKIRDSKLYTSVDDKYQYDMIKVRKLKVIEILEPTDIKIATYNILIPYQMHNKKFDKDKKDIKGANVMWFYRWELIKREINLYKPDIICFQEVQNDLFNRDMLPQLLQHGYTGYYIASEPRVDTKSINKYNYFDYSYSVGLAIFFKNKQFRVIHVTSLDFVNYATRYLESIHDDIIINENFKNKLNSMGANLIILFEDLMTYKRFYVSNIHIVSSPVLDDIKTLMCYIALRYIYRRIGSENHGLIFCGDFNSLPTSNVYNGITTGHVRKYGKTINEIGIERELIEPIFNLKDEIFTDKTLKSCYKEIYGKEPQYTNYTPKFKETLDYIFVNNNVQIIGSLESPDLSGIDRIPNDFYGSDHILQMAVVRLL